MTTIKFQPTVYRLTTQKGYMTWDLLTVDGEAPDTTYYFHLKGDMPSMADQQEIDENILGRCEWEKLTLDESGYKLSDFEIIEGAFDECGDAYNEIRKTLIDLATVQG